MLKNVLNIIHYIYVIIYSIMIFQVVSQMQCLMGENSVDYMVKFANLASQIASDENKK